MTPIVPIPIAAIILAIEQAVSEGPAEPRFASLPENPCAVLTVQQVAAATGTEVTESRRVPSILKVVEAQREGREPLPGTICAYSTGSEFGQLSIHLPPRSERRSTTYWEARERYFRTYPGSARPILNLGIDAWLAGGASLQVLVREDEYFVVSTQWYQPRSSQVLTALSRAVLERLESSGRPTTR
jgi:hypothetical protein